MCDVAPSARRQRGAGTADILHRLCGNDPTLRCLRLSPELITSPDILNAFLRNETIRSVVFTDVTEKTVPEVSFARCLNCLYHLPLRSLLAGGGLRLTADYMRHVLDLVEYTCGVGRGCKWVQDGGSKGVDEVPYYEAAAEVVSSFENNNNNNNNNNNININNSLKSVATLEFLDLSGNDINESQALKLANMIFHPRSSLRHVDLSECRLGSAGVRNLLNQQQQHTFTSRMTAELAAATQMEIFDLRWNGVTEDDGLHTFLDSLEAQSACITCIHADGNYISPELCRRLSERESKVLPVIEERRRARRAKEEQARRQEEEEERKEKEKQEQLLKEREREQMRNLVSPSTDVLNILLTIAADTPSSLPSLRMLAAYLLQRKKK